jgi:transmembrane sensor
MNLEPDYIINKFISGKRLTEEEFSFLDNLLNNLNHRTQLTHMLEEKWNQSEIEEVKIKFEQIKEKIGVSTFRLRMNRLFIVLGKAAAVLFIPLLAAALYYFTNQPVSHEMLTLSTERGEISNVTLPDGSRVWLNVDSRMSYPVSYGIKSRNLELKGETYFEVAQNEEIPFEVTTENLTTKALGTHFVISAYPESSTIKSSLIEGSVEVSIENNQKILNPGQQVVLDKGNRKLVVQSFDEECELGWKNDELIFRLTPFGDVISKLEKWYDINIECNPDLFKSETLTVRFEKHETLEQVLRVFSKANGFSYTVEGKNIIIKKMKKEKV